MDRPEKSSREASGAELWQIFLKIVPKTMDFGPFSPPNASPVRPRQRVSPVSSRPPAMHSVLICLTSKNPGTSGNVESTPNSLRKIRNRGTPESAPRAPQKYPHKPRHPPKVPGKYLEKHLEKYTEKCTWCTREKTRKCTPEAAGVYPEKSLESTLKVPGKVFQKCPESTRKRHPKYTENPRPCNFQELSWVLSRRGTFPSPRRVLLVHYSQYFPGATGNWLRKHLRPGHPPTPLAGVRRL